MAGKPQAPLTDEERAGITLAVQSAFVKLRNLYREIVPIFQGYGFTAPSAGVIARDLSEKIEASIVQHCRSFLKGEGHCDLSRNGHDWEVKICKDSGLTINQSKQIAGENYIVINYRADTEVRRIWVLWDARDEFFSARRPNTNARAVLAAVAKANIEVVYVAPVAAARVEPESAGEAVNVAPIPSRSARMAKATLRAARRRQAG